MCILHCPPVQVQLASRGPGAFDAPLAVPSGHDAICTAPYSAWDLDAPRNGASVQRVRFGGFAAGAAAFDAAAFGITGAEAELMDPQQRVLMEVHRKLQEEFKSAPS